MCSDTQTDVHSPVKVGSNSVVQEKRVWNMCIIDSGSVPRGCAYFFKIFVQSGLCGSLTILCGLTERKESKTSHWNCISDILANKPSLLTEFTLAA